MDKEILTEKEALSDIKNINLVLSHILTFGKIQKNETIVDWPTPIKKDKKIHAFLEGIMDKYCYGWYIVDQEQVKEQVDSLIKFQEYIISHIGKEISINRHSYE